MSSDEGHIDVFTGMAGFTLACHWADIQTEVMCENDKRCRQFLERTWPGIPIVPDVRGFDGTEWRGQFLLTAGVPCQPASRAGKQRGKEDDRWLWDETLRVVSEARPDWCLFENPPGIDDVGLGGILADLEAQGYEVAPPLIIPACAVNSPQLRARYWIVAYNNKQSIKKDTDREGKSKQTDWGTLWNINPSIGQGNVALPIGGRQERAEQQPAGYSQHNKGDMADTSRAECLQGRNDKPGNKEGAHTKPTRNPPYQAQWDNSLWLPCADGKVRRAPDDTFGVVDGLHRSLLAGLGNSIVPQVAYEIIRAIKEADAITP